MQLHTCQTVAGLVIREEWITEENAFEFILCHGLLGQTRREKKKKKEAGTVFSQM